MLITTTEELRLVIPSHAIDHVEALTGFITNSEHDFLRQPLGPPLYDRLCQYYDTIRNATEQGGSDDTIDKLIEMQRTNALGRRYYARLLFLAQRCVAFDALAAAIDVQAVSLNNAGVNFATADDYSQASDKAVANAKTAYIREARKALNILLETLEQWTQDCPAAADAEAGDEELLEIVNFWRSSRYFYLAAQLIIPSATVLTEYLDIYDSREKFIRMLPDLHFIQEEQIATVIGEDFMDHLVACQLAGGTKRDATAATAARPQSLADDSDIPPMTRRLLHKLRKIAATMLRARTSVIKFDKDERIAARDEAVRLLGQLRDYCRQHQRDILAALDTQAGLAPRALAMLTEAEITALQYADDPDKALTAEQIQQYLSAEQPFTSSPYYTSPAALTAAASPSASPAGAASPCPPCARSASAAASVTPDKPDADALFVTPPLF